MSIENISNSLNNLYKKTNNKTGNIVIVTCIIIIWLVIVIHIRVKTIGKYISSNKDIEECNPKYLYYSGWLKTNEKNPIQATADQFNKCVTYSVKNKYRCKIKKTTDTSNKQLHTLRRYRNSLYHMILTQYLIILKYFNTVIDMQIDSENLY